MNVEYGTEDWKTLRDTKLSEWIGDVYAVDFVLKMFHVGEVWDDLIDKDEPVEDKEINQLFWSLLIDLPLNPFFDKYKYQITPVLVTGINAWLDATAMEKNKDSNDRVFAYVLRDWYMEFLSFIVYLCRGREYLREVSLEIRKFFTDHENLDQYLEKLS